MNNYRVKSFALSAVFTVGGLLGAVSSASAANLENVLQAGANKHQASKASQERIDTLSEQTDKLIAQYKRVSKEVDGLKVYNNQLQKQIDNQNKQLAELDESIDQVTVIERQITPLMLRMVSGLEQFVELDAPFHPEERAERLAFVKAAMDRSDVSKSEQFRQVLEAYQVEAEYGRKIDTYKDTIDVNGAQREVNILRIGRIALLYQTTDEKVSGRYNSETGSWEVLDDSYRGGIRQGLKMARKQATTDILILPISAPEAAQ